MPNTSFSKMLRDLSSDYYHRAITPIEYRQRRKILLDEIDAEYNRYSLDNEDITTLGHQHQSGSANQISDGGAEQDSDDNIIASPSDDPGKNTGDDTNKNWFRR